MLFSLLLAASALAVDSGELRAVLVSELRVGGDPIGWAAGDFLLLTQTSLSVGPTAKVGGRSPAALYDNGSRRIVVDEDFVKASGAGQASAVARRIAPTIVHEIEHARTDAEAPGAPAMREGEVAAYLAEALFLRKRLEADAAYNGLEKIDKAARKTHGLPAPKGEWWREPLPEGQERRLSVVAMPEGVDPVAGLYWFNARAAAGGLSGLTRAYEAAGLLSRLPPAEKACSPSLPVETRKACGKAAELLKERIASLEQQL